MGCLDRLINLGLGVVISVLVGVIAYNLFWPQKEMDVSQPTPAEQVQEMTSKIDEYITLGQLNAAQHSIDDAMKIATGIAGPEGPEVARVLEKRGMLKVKQGNASAGMVDYEHAYSIFDKTNGMEFDSLKGVCVKMADVYFKRKEFDKAGVVLERGIKAAEKASDEDAQARFWRSLALVKEKSDKLDEAAECNDKASRLSRN